MWGRGLLGDMREVERVEKTEIERMRGSKVDWRRREKGRVESINKEEERYIR